MKTAGFCRLKRIGMRILLILLSAAFFVSGSTAVSAEASLLSDFTWELLFTENLHNPGAVVQGLGVTEDYIYTIENTADDAALPDIVSVYYRNNTDPYSNPVQQYSLYNIDGNRHWEHGNGMTYNPKTGELFVAPYTHIDPENRGCLLVMDPDTLECTRKIKISDSYDILSVSYDRINDLYYIQTNGEALYTNLVLNADFEVINELGPEDPTPGYNFQAFCLSGDYLLQSPLTINLGIGNYLMAYSVSARQVADVVAAEFGLEAMGYTKVEPEAIVRLDDDSYLLVVDATYPDKTGTAYYYRLTFPNLPKTEPLFEEKTREPEEDTENTAAGEAEPEQKTEQETAREAAEAAADGAENAAEERKGNAAAEPKEDAAAALEKDSVQAGTELPAGEVTITRAHDLIVGRTPVREKGPNPLPVVLLIVFLVGGGLFVCYLNMVRIRRARQARDARIRRMRKQARREVAGILEEENEAGAQRSDD